MAASTLEEELYCAICLDFYTNPRILPCQHSFCELCLCELLSSAPQPGGTQPCGTQLGGTQSHPRAAIICPSCRQRFVFDAAAGEKGVDQFPRNFSLASIVDRYRRESAAKSKMAEVVVVPCDLCEGKGKSPASKQCCQCQASYCDDCFLMFHPMRGPLAKHSILNPTEASARSSLSGGDPSSGGRSITCPDHKGKDLDLFCVNCQRPICYLCDRVGGHHEHQMCDLQTAFENKKVGLFYTYHSPIGFIIIISKAW